MKKYSYLLIYSLCCGDNQPPPINVNINNNPQQNISFSFDINQTMQTIKTSFKKSFNTYRDELGAFTHWLMHHLAALRRPLLLTACIVPIMYMWYSIRRDKRKIFNKQRWAYWKRGCKILHLRKQQDLMKELIHEIYHRYINPERPLDSNYPLARFYKTINQEMQQLRIFLRKSHWIYQLYLGIPFWVRKQDIDQTRLFLKRTAFIRSLFKDWISEQNLAHFQAAQAA